MISPAPTLVCFAVKEEAGHFKRVAQAAPGIRILITGMGRKNAQEALRAALSDPAPGRVITAGFAGALIPELSRGTVVFFTDTDTVLQDQLLRMGARRTRFHCAEQVATTVEQKRTLFARTGAEAVDMESRFIHLLCQERQIPATTVRVILDTAEEDLVLDFNSLMTPDLRIDGRKLALAILKSPSRIPALLVFQKQSAAAARCLGETLAQLLLTGSHG